MRVVACDAADAGTGRLRVPGGGRLGAAAELHLASDTVLCGLLSSVRWSDAAVATADVLVWRGAAARPALGSEGEAVREVRLLEAAALGELAELELVPEDEAGAAALRSGGREAALWATQVARELLQECVFPPGDGWRFNGGPLLGRLLVASPGRGRVTRRTAVRLLLAPPRSLQGPRVGGLDNVYAALRQAARAGQCALLKGPPGTGKTALVRSLCAREGFGLQYVHGTADRRQLLAAFADARHEASRPREEDEGGAEGPRVCVVFIDEVDVLRCPRELLALMDGAAPRPRDVVVVGATNCAERLDPALRRPGRFDCELLVGIPTLAMRRDILRVHAPPGLDVEHLAARTVGYVGADLVALLREARELSTGDAVTWEDVERALVLVGPSPMRGAGVEVPRVAWDDIGGLEDVKEALRRAIEWPITRAADMAALEVRAARGVLLHGPPGCAKTTLVRALATNICASFLILTPETVYSPFVGSAEATVRECFERARGVAPCIVFIDEIDALAGRRGGADEGHSVQQRVLSTLLNEMDGLDTTTEAQVVVVAATNRLDMLDEALLRPGRFDNVLAVRPPQTAAERLAVLRVHARGMSLAAGVAEAVLPRLAAQEEATGGLSGAQLEAVCREAGLACMREDLDSQAVEERHFEQALAKVRELL